MTRKDRAARQSVAFRSPSDRAPLTLSELGRKHLSDEVVVVGPRDHRGRVAERCTDLIEAGAASQVARHEGMPRRLIPGGVDPHLLRGRVPAVLDVLLAIADPRRRTPTVLQLAGWKGNSRSSPFPPLSLRLARWSFRTVAASTGAGTHLVLPLPSLSSFSGPSHE